MDIRFASKKLEKQFNEAKVMQKTFGAERSRCIRLVMTSLRAAPSLGVFAPPFSPPHRCHELTKNRKGMLSLDLDGPNRLIIEPLHQPLPLRPEGGLDWQQVTAIKVLGVENTHGK